MKERLLLRKKLRRSPYLNKRSAAKSTQGIFGTRADGACGAVTIQAPPNSAANDKDGRLNSILFVWFSWPREAKDARMEHLLLGDLEDL